MKDNKGRYGVGYGKPPKHSRFQKGKSGNPKGRPRRPKGFAGIVWQKLNDPVEIQVSGRVQTINKREAIIRQLIAKAATGNLRALETLLLKMELLKLDWLEPGQQEGLTPEIWEKAKLLVRGSLD